MSKQVLNKDLMNGLGRELRNSLALFIYYENYETMPNVIEIYNEWSRLCGFRTQDIEKISCILEHIRKLSNVKRTDLQKALKMDHLI